VQTLTAMLERAGPWGPWLCVLLFAAASLLMIWRLDSMCRSGLEGTVLGTLVMPYCSGFGNLVFVFVVAREGGPGAEVVTNALVNNVTNLTLLLGLPAALWGLRIVPSGTGTKAGNRRGKGRDQARQIDRLSLLLTLAAALFFVGATWALGRDRRIDFDDGLVLVGLFLFWQCFHVFEVLKTNVRQNRTLGWVLALDLLLLAAGAVGVYGSIDWLVSWLCGLESGFISVRHLGWLSGWLMVLPNGLMAVYYAWRRQPDIAYTSQVGDGHICIPLGIGLFALIMPIQVPPVFDLGLLVVGAAAAAHFVLVSLLGGLPRLLGWALVAGYGIFLYEGLGNG
jgi:cation:H+ antiporter